MNETAYPTLDEVLALHAETMGIPVDQARDNVRDLGLLESEGTSLEDAQAWLNQHVATWVPT